MTPDETTHLGRQEYDDPVVVPAQAGDRVGPPSAESEQGPASIGPSYDLGPAAERVDASGKEPAFLEQLRDEQLEGRRTVGTVSTVMEVLDRLRSTVGFQVGAPRQKKKDFTHIDVAPCLFNPAHKKATISIHKLGSINYLCPHHSCRGLKEGHAKKGWPDVLALLGDTQAEAPPTRARGGSEGEVASADVLRLVVPDRTVNAGPLTPTDSPDPAGS